MDSVARCVGRGEWGGGTSSRYYDFRRSSSRSAKISTTTWNDQVRWEGHKIKSPYRH